MMTLLFNVVSGAFLIVGAVFSGEVMNWTLAMSCVIFGLMLFAWSEQFKRKRIDEQQAQADRERKERAGQQDSEHSEHLAAQRRLADATSAAVAAAAVSAAAAKPDVGSADAAAVASDDGRLRPESDELEQQDGQESQAASNGAPGLGRQPSVEEPLPLPREDSQSS